MNATQDKPNKPFVYRERNPELLRKRIRHYGYRTDGIENQWLFGASARFEPTTHKRVRHYGDKTRGLENKRMIGKRRYG